MQNLGLMLFKMLAGKILAASKPRDAIVSSAPDFYVSGAIWVEVMFVVVCVIALLLAIGLRRSSRRHPELHLDVPVSSGR